MGKCACGRTFHGSGSTCPQCRRDERWEEDFRNTDWDVEQQGLDGDAEGQATLDGGIEKPDRGDEDA